MSVTAPCGHPGEHVIGAYVRCLQGCTKDPYVQPKAPPPPARKTPGHVDMCACPMCTVRRRGREVILRTKDGKEYRAPWDGSQDKVSWNYTGKVKGELRHWKLVDEDGDVVGGMEGICNVPVSPGDIVDIDLKAVPARLEFRHRKGYAGLRQAAKCFNFDLVPQARPSQARPWTRAGIHNIAMSVPGVARVEVIDAAGVVAVSIRETTCRRLLDEKLCAEQLHTLLEAQRPVGVQIAVTVDTPMMTAERFIPTFKDMIWKHATVAEIKAALACEFAPFGVDLVDVQNFGYAWHYRVQYRGSTRGKQWLQYTLNL